MITNEIFSDELLQQAAAELAAAINNSLSPPNEYQHRFPMALKKRCNRLSTV